jgi:hypothetical protein
MNIATGADDVLDSLASWLYYHKTAPVGGYLMPDAPNVTNANGKEKIERKADV